MKQKKIKIPLYGGNIYVYIGEREEFAELLYKKVGVDFSSDVHSGCDGLCFELTNPEGGSFIGMWFPQDAPNGVIVHECLHATWYVNRYFGVNVDADNNEPQAYLLQYLVEQMEKLMK